MRSILNFGKYRRVNARRPAGDGGHCMYTYTYIQCTCICVHMDLFWVNPGNERENNERQTLLSKCSLNQIHFIVMTFPICFHWNIGNFNGNIV